MDALVTYVIEDRDVERAPRRLLLCLHGHGATEHDLTALGPLVDPDGHHLVAGLRGPVPVEGGGAAWFTAGPRGPDAGTVATMITGVRAAIAGLCERFALEPEHTVLMGFSQGAAAALAVALAPGAAPPPAGVLCLSGFLLDEPALEPQWWRAAHTAVLVQHGDRDAVVDPALGVGTAEILAHHGVPVTAQRYPMGHQMTVESLGAARDWLERVRGGERPSAPAGS